MRRATPTRTARGTAMERWGPFIPALALLCLALAGPALSAARAESGNAWRIVLRDVACVQGSRVTLGEIADIEGQAPDGAWEALSASPLWEAPAVPGRQVQVVRKQLEKLLAHYLPEAYEACVLPSRLVYQLGGKVYSRDDLGRLVVGFLTPRLKPLGGETEIKDLRVPDYIFLDRDYDNLELALAGDPGPGRLGIKFRVTTSDGKIVGRYSGSVFINLWKAVPCAAEPLSKFEKLTTGKVTWMRKNLAYVGPVWDGRSGPYRAGRSVGTGMPLLLEYLEPMPLIAKGDTVNLVYSGATIHLAVKAEALNDADKGELVEVRNKQSNRTVMATAMDEHTVVVR